MMETIMYILKYDVYQSTLIVFDEQQIDTDGPYKLVPFKYKIYDGI